MVLSGSDHGHADGHGGGWHGGDWNLNLNSSS